MKLTRLPGQLAQYVASLPDVSWLDSLTPEVVFGAVIPRCIIAIITQFMVILFLS